MSALLRPSRSAARLLVAPFALLSTPWYCSGAAATAAVPPAPARCPAAAAVDGPGILDPFHVPLPLAAASNADGKLLYRQGRWEEARAKYRAAEAADPAFLAPALNVACSFVRQERYGDALAEATRLVRRAYLPWSREILDAADLGALKVRAEGASLRAALEDARHRWAEGLAGDVILVARLRPALGLGGGRSQAADQRAPIRPPPASSPASPAIEPRTEGNEQALVLGQRQEVLAWSPRTRRYRQLTSEDGRVLAVGRSPDGDRIAYVTAEKLIRVAGTAPALRGVAVTELDLNTLAVRDRAVVTGDVRRLEIIATANGFLYRIEGGQPQGITGPLALNGGRLDIRVMARSARPPQVVLTGDGVRPHMDPVRLPGAGTCPAVARDWRFSDGRQTVRVAPIGRDRNGTSNIEIGGPNAAGLFGLPIVGQEVRPRER